MSFVPLHVYSGFSYLESALSAKLLPVYAKKYHYQAIAICDDGTLSGYAPFTHSALDGGIHPVYGMDVRFGDEIYSLFVQNETGYRNLLPLTLLCSEQKVTKEQLIAHATGLTLVYSPDPFYFGRLSEAEEKTFAENLSRVTRTFSSCYLGIPYYPNNAAYIARLRGFAARYSYPTIAFPFLRYEKKADAIALEILQAIQKQENLTQKEKSGNECFLTPEELAAFYSLEELNRTGQIADETDFKLLQKRGGLLHYPNDLGLTSEELLRKMTLEGLQKHVPNASQEYLDRIDYELSVINKMGYADYFLIVQDYVNWAKTHGVSVGPGRGSGAGSLVSYCLGIVTLDPVRYHLIFERFLNPERRSMPDIDVDFADVSRDRVVRYLQDKYGIERVGHVLTTQNILAKQALRDVGRVYGYDDSKEVSPLISTLMYPMHSLRFNYRNSPKFKEKVDSDRYYLTLVGLAAKIEGLPRQAGLHAAGIVLNDTPLPTAIPTSDNPEVGYVACLEKDYLEEQGFLKMDLLGLRNLTIIDECLTLIAKDKGVKLDAEKIPYDDPDSIAIIRQGKVMGLFQLESGGMKRAIQTVQPTSFEDVAALLALFRPGPMESIPSFARRKHGQEKIEYLAPELEPILKDTYGIIVYQEQIMQIVRAMAGFSYGQADLFRRAISKKKVEQLNELKSSFLEGCAKNGKDSAVAEKVYDLIFRFANYGFNKSHAYSYAVITCQMAYLKKHYPAEFYCAILDFLSPSDPKFASTLQELKELQIRLVVPDVNRSGLSFQVEGQSIRFPLTPIKDLQGKLASAIVDERNTHGPYTDFFDFASRLKSAGLNLRLLVRLVDAGAFDSLCPSRQTLRASAASAMQYADLTGGEENGQQFLTDIGIAKPLLEREPDDLRANLEAEYNALGMMVSGSPLSLYQEEIKKLPHYCPLHELGNAPYHTMTAGVLRGARAITTKSGKKMAFLELYDEVSVKEFTVFPSVYEACYAVLTTGAVLAVECHKDDRKDGTYIIDSARALGENEP